MSVDPRVVRLEEPEALRGLYRVTFERARQVSHDPTREGDAAEPPGRVVELERELQYTKESHQSTNEELQSANEELETSKEEVQSLNEELQTVNTELQGKVDELSRANNDMKNLLNGTDIATIFLDEQLRIKRYTEQAKKVIRHAERVLGSRRYTESSSKQGRFECADSTRSRKGWGRHAADHRGRNSFAPGPLGHFEELGCMCSLPRTEGRPR